MHLGREPPLTTTRNATIWWSLRSNRIEPQEVSEPVLICSPVLNRTSFRNASLSKSVRACDEQASLFAIPTVFFQNIYFYDVRLKNYLK